MSRFILPVALQTKAIEEIVTYWSNQMIGVPDKVARNAVEPTASGTLRSFLDHCDSIAAETAAGSIDSVGDPDQEETFWKMFVDTNRSLLLNLAYASGLSSETGAEIVDLVFKKRAN